MTIISVQGFYDTHVHTGPAPFRRIGDTVDIARWCAEAGMAGFVAKSHFEATIAKAYHARKEVPDFKVFSGIALNRGVGGVNPAAVEQALQQGAKVVWLPTIDAKNHARVFGATGTFGFSSYTLKKSARPRGNYTVMENGKLTEDIKEVIELVVEYDAVLATAHVAPEEILAVVDYAAGKKHRKILITHPEYNVPDLDLNTVVDLAKLGCFFEFCAASCSPIMHVVVSESSTLVPKLIGEIKEMIDAVTPEQSVIATDSGQPFSPRTPEALRIFAQILSEKGVSETAIEQMAIKNPAYLLGVTPDNRQTESVQTA